MGNVNKRQNRNKWGFRLPLGNGKRKWVYRWDTKEQAEAAYEAHAKAAKLPATALRKASEAYLLDSSARRSERRIEELTYDLHRWIIPHWGEHCDIRSITSESVESFISLHRGRVKPITIWHYVKNLRSLLNWCIRKKLLATNPVAQADLSVIKNRKTTKMPLNQAAIEKGLACLKGRERLYAYILGYMGLRRNEGNYIRAKDFRDLGDNGLWLVVHGTKTEESLRVIPVPPILHATVRAELSRVENPEVYITSPKGVYIRDRRKMFKRVSKAAGIKITPKDMRDYFASILDDPITASQMLGHTNLKTTAIYVRQVQQRMLQSVAKINPEGSGLAATSGCQWPLKQVQNSEKPTQGSKEPFHKYLKYFNSSRGA